MSTVNGSAFKDDRLHDLRDAPCVCVLLRRHKATSTVTPPEFVTRRDSLPLSLSLSLSLPFSPVSSINGDNFFFFFFYFAKVFYVLDRAFENWQCTNCLWRH